MTQVVAGVPRVLVHAGVPVCSAARGMTVEAALPCPYPSPEKKEEEKSLMRCCVPESCVLRPMAPLGHQMAAMEMAAADPVSDGRVAAQLAPAEQVAEATPALYTSDGRPQQM